MQITEDNITLGFPTQHSQKLKSQLMHKKGNPSCLVSYQQWKINAYGYAFHSDTYSAASKSTH
jgi:hypothetical protein